VGRPNNSHPYNFRSGRGNYLSIDMHNFEFIASSHRRNDSAEVFPDSRLIDGIRRNLGADLLYNSSANPLHPAMFAKFGKKLCLCLESDQVGMLL